MKVSVFFSSLMLLPTMVTYAADEDFCSDYVLVAISQYWQSVDQSCGFTGSRWNAKYKGQFDWCLTAHQWVAESETDIRHQMLEECRSNKSTDTSEETSETSKVSLDDSSLVSTSDSLNKQLLNAVAKNDVKQAQALVSQGADIHYVTHDKDLIKTLGMSSRVGENITIQTSEYSAPSEVTNEKEGEGTDDAIALKAASKVVTKDTSVLVEQTAITDVQGKQVESESLLSYATSRGLLEVGLWLLEQNKNLPEPTRSKMKVDLLGRALIGAVKGEQHEQVKTLLEEGALVNYELDQNSGTPLYFAVNVGSEPIVTTLLKQGADPKYSTNAGQNMLNFALDKPALLKVLLEHGADPNFNGESSNTDDYPIIKAVKQGNVRAVDLLMTHGADANVYDYEVTYPLLQAIIDEQVEIVKILLKHNVNPNVVYNSDSPGICIEGRENVVPLSQAIKSGNTAIVKLLKEVDAKTVENLCKKK